METVQINRKRAVYELNDLDIKLIREEPNRLMVVFNEKMLPDVSVGTKLVFVRNIYNEGGTYDFVRNAIEVQEITSYTEDNEVFDAVYTTRPEYKTMFLPDVYNQFTIKGSKEECVNRFDSYVPESGGCLTVFNGDGLARYGAIDYYTGETPCFILTFTEPHNIFAQDIYEADKIGGFSISVLNNRGGRIGEFTGISIPFEDNPESIGSADTLSYKDEWTCDLPNKFRTYTYNYFRPTFSRNKIKFTSASTTHMNGTFEEVVKYLLNNGKRFVANFNPFYYYQMLGAGDKRCTLWEDPWWPQYEEKNHQHGTSKPTEVYVNNGNSGCYLGKEYAYWKIPSIYVSSDGPSLDIEDEQRERYVNDIISESIPDVVDMERLKYKPVRLYANDEYANIKSITLDFHFRKRETTSDNPYPIYKDAWNIPVSAEPFTWWNGFDYSNVAFDGSKLNSFITASGAVSDLLGYLNFTDDDVFYRKSRLSKSFVRLSFYTSPDPIEQKLLYYSTIFLDSTALYGKYLKQSSVKQDYGIEDDGIPVVFYANNILSARLDTEIVIKDEFNTDKSSEGFNIYLFADDATGVNSARTIYMKVEFNHAGNGKTIPMVLWPKAPISRETIGDNDGSNVLGEAESTLLEPYLVLGVGEQSSAETEICGMSPAQNEGTTIGDTLNCNGDGQNPCDTGGCGSDTCADCSDCSEGVGFICESQNTESGFGDGGLICGREDCNDGCTEDGITNPDIPCDGECLDAICSNPRTDAQLCFRGDLCLDCEDVCSNPFTDNGCFNDGTPIICRNIDCTAETCTGEICNCDDDCSAFSDPQPPVGVGYQPITVKNFLSSLYIPVEIRYINGEYVYSIKGAEHEVESGNIRLILFEPKLDNEEDL